MKAKAAAFRTSCQLCSVVSPEEVATEFKVKADDPVEIARVYAKVSYRAIYRRAAAEGCIHGFALSGAIT